MGIKDKNILRRIRKGDIKAFESLFHHYYPGMCLYAVSLLKNEDQSEEIVQDVFYNIWKNREEFNLHTSWRSYLYKAVFNNSMMQLRRSKKEVRADEEWLKTQADIQTGTDGELNYNELNELIVRTLDQLPERTRQIFKMNRFEGLKYKEIARELSISIKTVEANMGKALKALKIALKELGYEQ